MIEKFLIRDGCVMTLSAQSIRVAEGVAGKRCCGGRRMEPKNVVVERILIVSTIMISHGQR